MSKITSTDNALLKTKYKCELCGNTSFKIIYKKRGVQKEAYFITDDSYGAHTQIVKCLECGLIFVYPREKDQKIQHRYTSFIDPEYEEERIARSENQRALVRECEKLYCKQGKLLDIGCATGGLLEVARQDGWDTMGIEPSLWAVKVASEKYKLNVINGLFNNNKFKKESFDVVTCVDVVEHVTSPKDLLNGINKILKPDGILCIVTPNKQSIIAKMLGEKWWHIRPDHIFYFSKDNFSKLLQLTGFKIEKINEYKWTFSFDYWASRFKNKIPIIYWLLMFMKKNPLTRPLTHRSYSINFRDSLEIYCRRI